MTREEKITAIYKEMANKKVSFGCKYMHNGYRYTVDDSNYRLHKEWNNYCLYIGTICNCPIEIVGKYNEYKNHWVVEIIGHPVMIWDVIDWIEKKDFDINKKIPWFWFEDEKGIDDESKLFLIQGYYTDKIIAFWDKKRESIEYQSDDCIDFIYSLIAK